MLRYPHINYVGLLIEYAQEHKFLGQSYVDMETKFPMEEGFIYVGDFIFSKDLFVRSEP
ncbi:hypothetical protein ACFLZN_00375 [Nanoarchaeota archaeon]